MKSACTAAFLSIGLFGGFIAPAQSPRTAPDFTAKDLQGKEWNLYRLLDEGKAVVLHLMSTHSLPSWAYHHGRALQTLHHQLGPESPANRVRVFLVESDPNTNSNCLYGFSGCNSATLGNWVAGTPFPVINDHEIAPQFGVADFPALVLICPNRKFRLLRLEGADRLAEEALSCPVLFGQNNAAIVQLDPGFVGREVCMSAAFSPHLQLVNLGKHPLYQAVLQLEWNAESLFTIAWQGELGSYEETSLDFPTFVRSEGGTLQARILSINGGAADEDENNNSVVQVFENAPRHGGEAFLLKIRTDQFGAETYWEVRDEQGRTLSRGGNQNVGPTGGGQYTAVQGGMGAYGDNATIYDTLYLPTPGCYSLHFVDAYGDGMCCDHGQGYFHLYRLEEPLGAPLITGGNFAAYEHRRFNTDMGSSVQLSSGEKGIALRLWPNPTAEQVQISLQQPSPERLSIAVFDIFGRTAIGQREFLVSQEPLVISVQHLSPGIYWILLRNSAGISRQPLVVAR